MPDKNYQDGYKSGYQDARSGKENHPRPGFTKSLFSRSYAVQFIKGYRHGYNYRLLQERKSWMNKKERKKTLIKSEKLGKAKFTKSLFNQGYVDTFIKGCRYGYHYRLLQECKDLGKTEKTLKNEKQKNRSGFER